MTSMSKLAACSKGVPARQRDEFEIEITPAMLREGVSALCRYDCEFESREEGVERIFRAMCAASSKVLLRSRRSDLGHK
jgi:hypothetical protein